LWLVVWNDGEIAPGTGFGLHGQANMEIISYVRDGSFRGCSGYLLSVYHRSAWEKKPATAARDPH
jgi:hypothetical protein